jgi:hypothetical protein
MLFTAVIKVETANIQNYDKQPWSAFDYLHHVIHPTIMDRICPVPIFNTIQATRDIIGFCQPSQL